MFQPPATFLTTPHCEAATGFAAGALSIVNGVNCIQRLLLKLPETADNVFGLPKLWEVYRLAANFIERTWLCEATQANINTSHNLKQSCRWSSISITNQLTRDSAKILDLIQPSHSFDRGGHAMLRGAREIWQRDKRAEMGLYCDCLHFTRYVLLGLIRLLESLGFQEYIVLVHILLRLAVLFPHNQYRRLHC